MQSSTAVAGMDALSESCENILTRRANQWHYSIIAPFAKRPWPCPTTGFSSGSIFSPARSLPLPQPTRFRDRMGRRERVVAGRVQCRVWRSKCTVSSGGDARADFTLSSPMRKIHQAPFTCLEPDRELLNPSWMLLDLVMSKKNAADITIDPIHSRAICDEIGERLRQVLKRESVGLPPRLQLLVDRLAELDGAAAPSIVPSFEEMLPRRELHSSSAQWPPHTADFADQIAATNSR